jgi:hypothetical protein
MLWLRELGETFVRYRTMSDDRRQRPMRARMPDSAQTRVTQYRRQAAELRDIAETQIDESVRRELRDLAAKYDALANSVSKSESRKREASNG